jgi:hypothetical protein
LVQSFDMLRPHIYIAFLLVVALFNLPHGVAADDATQPTTTKVKRQPGDTMDLIAIDAKTKKPIPGMNIVNGGIPDVFKGTTRADGHCDVPLPFQAIEGYFAITLRGKGYASQRLVWGSNSSPDDIPDQFTVELEKAAAVSGIVVDDAGKPVAGAKVSINFRQQFKDPHEKLDVGGSRNIIVVTTGRDGRWSYGGAPPSPDSVWIAVSDGRAPTTEPAATPALEPFEQIMQLYDGSATLKLSRPDAAK